MTQFALPRSLLKAAHFQRWMLSAYSLVFCLDVVETDDWTTNCCKQIDGGGLRPLNLKAN